jgi:hypothetical protein
MYRKIISFFLCGLFLSTVIILPTMTTKGLTMQNHTQLGPTRKQLDPTIPSQKMYIKGIYKQTVEKVTLGLNPSEEVSILLSNPDIQTIIKDISDEQTLEIMNTLFSNKPIFTKLQAIHVYEKKINGIQENESIQLFEQMFKRLINTNLTPEEPTFLPEAMLTEENKSMLFSIWMNYLNTHPNISSLLNSRDIDIFMFAIFFILAALIWGSIIGSIAFTNPEALSVATMYVEAVGVGLIGSFLTDIPFSGDFPVLQKMLKSFCNRTGLTQSQIENVVSSLICLILVASYCFVWTVPIFKLSLLVRVGGAIMVVGPPLLVGVIAAIYQPPGNESLLKTYY